MTTMQALEYSVDSNGLVTSKATYRVISVQQWDRARDVPSARYAPYDAMVRELTEGRILAVPCVNRLRARHVATTLRRKARACGFDLQVRIVGDLDGKEGLHALARRDPQRVQS